MRDQEFVLWRSPHVEIAELSDADIPALRQFAGYLHNRRHRDDPSDSPPDEGGEQDQG